MENPDNSHIFEFTECATGKTVKGKISGGESNIRGIAYDWDGEGTGWNSRAFYFYTRELKNREFNALWKSLDYAGCESKELKAYIRAELAKQE